MILDAKESFLQFKIRLLDLVEIYLKNCTANPNALKLFAALPRLANLTLAKKELQRVYNRLLKIPQACMKSVDVSTDFESVFTTVEDIVNYMYLPRTHANISQFVGRVLYPLLRSLMV